jgi:hypothetical protein
MDAAMTEYGITLPDRELAARGNSVGSAEFDLREARGPVKG